MPSGNDENILNNPTLEHGSDADVPEDNASVDELLNDIEHHPEEEHQEDTETDDILNDPLFEGEDDDDDELSRLLDEEGDEDEEDDLDVESVDELGEETDEIETEDEESESGGTLLDRIKENKKQVIGMAAIVIVCGGFMLFIITNVLGALSKGAQQQPVKQEAYLQNLQANKPKQATPATVPNTNNGELTATIKSKPIPPPVQNQPTQVPTTEPVVPNPPAPVVQQPVVHPAQTVQPPASSGEQPGSVSDSIMIDKNTQAILKLAGMLKNTDMKIHEAVTNINATQQQLRAQINQNSQLLEKQVTAIKSLADSVIELKNSNRGRGSQVSYTAPKPRVFNQPTYNLITSSQGTAWVESRRHPSKLVKLEVGDNLIGYGRITAISPYGQINTTSGPVKLR